MKAIVITGKGGPEVLELKDVPTPRPSRGEVLVRVHATAVNRADILQRMGFYPAPEDAPRDIPGLEYAGEVAELGETGAAAGAGAGTGGGGKDGGEDTHAVAIGDRVFGLAGGGTYAEYVVAHARTLVAIPERMPFKEAAAVPESFITAFDAMVLQGRLSVGESVLIHAVGSGVGTAAVQIARALGARSIGTSRTQDKLDRARDLGLVAGVIATENQFADRVRAANAGRGVHVVLDLVGGAYVDEDLRCLESKGRIVVVGLMGGAKSNLSLGKLLERRASIHGTVLRSRPIEEKIEAAMTFRRHLLPLFHAGQLAPTVDRTYPLERVAEAHRYVESNQGFGKVVLTVSPAIAL